MVHGFNLMLKYLWAHPTDPCPSLLLMQERRLFDGDVCRLQRGPCKTPDEFRERKLLLFVNNWLFGIRYYELAQYEADDIIGTLDKMKETTGAIWCDHCLWGQGLIQLTDDNTVVEIPKRGSRVWRIHSAYSKKRWTDTWAVYSILGSLDGR